MNPRALVRQLLDRISTIFVVLGLLAIFAAAGTFLVLGQLDRTVIVLFAVGVGLLVYAALERPEQTAQTFSSRGVRYGTNTVVMGAAFLGILVLVNVLANRFSTQLDLTQNQLYTLSPLSVQVVKEIKQPIHIIAFYQTGDASRGSLEALLKEYTQLSDKISYEFVDPQLQPGLAHQYNVQNFGTTVLVSGGKQQSTTGSDEGSLTSAMLKLERNKPEVAYYLTGHGELDFTNTAQSGASGIKAAMEAQNFSMQPLNLAASGKVPSDAALVIVAGPTSPLLPQEVTALESYLDNGGKAIFLVDKGQRQNLEPIAEHYGVQIGNGVVIDPAQSLMNDPLSPLITQYQFSPVTKDLPELLFQAATSVTPMASPPSGLQVQPLAQTTDRSWLETNAKTIHFDPGVDPQGPLDVIVSVSRPIASASGTSAATGTEILFVGDVAFATNALTGFAPGNNQLLTNAANWLTSNQDLIQIQAKVANDRQLVLSNTQLNLMLYGSAVFLPLLVLGAGILVWWGRR